MYLSKHKYKKTCCIKIVSTNCFACEAQQSKKAILFMLKEIKIKQKLKVKINF